MIKANEARELVKTSDIVAERLLNWMDPQVRKLAEEGKTNFKAYTEELMVRCEGYSHNLKETPIMIKVLERLKLLGYRAEFVVEKNENRFRGLGVCDDDDHDPTPTYTKCISISW